MPVWLGLASTREDHASRAIREQIVERPIHQHKEAIAETDQIEEMHSEP